MRLVFDQSHYVGHHRCFGDYHRFGPESLIAMAALTPALRADMPVPANDTAPADDADAAAGPPAATPPPAALRAQIDALRRMTLHVGTRSGNFAIKKCRCNRAVTRRMGRDSRLKCSSCRLSNGI